jgi:hypothetical protein
VEKVKRSYNIPRKVADAFDKECDKYGYVREKVLAVMLMQFLESDPNARAKMFDRLDSFTQSKRG